MTFTTVAKVEAVMGKTFTDTTTPNTTQVSGTIIPLADNFVNKDDLTGLDSTDKEWLSTFMSAHIIASSKDVDFRSADVNVSISSIPTHYLRLYETFAHRKRSAFWTTVND